jgi:hypothetical protein
MASRPAPEPTKSIMGATFLGVKYPGLEADHSPPPSAGGVKKTWSTHLLPTPFMVYCLIALRVKHWNNFTFSYRYLRSALCECSSEVHYVNVLVKCFVQVF